MPDKPSDGDKVAAAQITAALIARDPDFQGMAFNMVEDAARLYAVVLKSVVSETRNEHPPMKVSAAAIQDSAARDKP